MTDLINRADAIEAVRKEDCCGWIECNADKIYDELNHLPSSQTDCTEFIMWLIEVILDDEDWELNAVGYGEIIARKMAKLGLLEVLDGYYIRTPNKPQSVVAEIKIDTDEIIKRISALPSAEAYFTDGNKIAEWIPCSERLPSESGDYLCTIPLNADETYTEVLTFYKGKFYEDDTDEWGALYHDDVLAWMPLPKPYREDGEE